MEPSFLGGYFTWTSTTWASPRGYGPCHSSLLTPEFLHREELRPFLTKKGHRNKALRAKENFETCILPRSLFPKALPLSLSDFGGQLPSDIIWHHCPTCAHLLPPLSQVWVLLSTYYKVAYLKPVCPFSCFLVLLVFFVCLLVFFFLNFVPSSINHTVFTGYRSAPTHPGRSILP